MFQVFPQLFFFLSKMLNSAELMIDAAPIEQQESNYFLMIILCTPNNSRCLLSHIFREISVPFFVRFWKL